MTRLLATSSAVLLGLAGATLLFAADVVVGEGASPAGVVIGQLLGAAWLALAAATWLARGAVLGGIYGRSIVMANTWVFMISALVCVRASWMGTAVWVTGAVAAVFAVLYAYLLFRGPLESAR